MSAKDQALKDPKLKDKNPAPGGIMEVTVKGKVGDPGIVPVTITLTNQVHTVHWTCSDLPRGTILQIHFPEDLRGPFVELRQFNTIETFGFGNRGPRATVEAYAYEARLVAGDGTSRLVGHGRLLNKATQKVGHPGTGSVDPLHDPPGQG